MHFKRDYLGKKFNRLGKQNNDGNVAIVLDAYESAEVLKISNIDSKRKWIIDSDCTFHMCPIKTWFENFIELDGAHVILENSKTYKVFDIGIVRLKMFNSVEYLLKGT